MPSVNWQAVVAIIAVLALVQPWLLAGYRKFYRLGRVEIYETGTIEVSSSQEGQPSHFKARSAL